MLSRISVVIALGLGLAPLGPPAKALATVEPEASFRLGRYERTLGPLLEPSSVAIAANDDIYVAEADRNRITVFSATGARLRSFGADLLRPQALAIAEDGAIVVADTGNHRVQVYAPDGTRQAMFGGYGAEAGRLNEPRGVAIRGDLIYVADYGNDRIQAFDRSGATTLTFGETGSDDGQFNRPVGVAVDENGFIFVADADNNRIQKFDRLGRYVASWGDWGPFAGLMDEPRSVVAFDGRLFVADTRNHRLQIFDSEGTLVEQWGVHARLPHEGEGRLHYPADVAIAPSGRFAVVCEPFENRCQVFAAAEADAEPAAPITAPQPMSSHFGERIHVDGTLLTVAEPENHRVYVFETSRDIPVIIGDFGERGGRFGQMIRVAGLDIDLDERRLYVSDVATHRLQTFDVTYDPEAPLGYSKRRTRFRQAFDMTRLDRERAGLTAPWPIEPAAIRRDVDGNVYVVDPRNSTVFVFDRDLEFVRSWGGYGGEPGRFRRPTDLAFAVGGETIFVVDADNRRVQAFDRSGRFLRAFPDDSADPSAVLQSPFGIAAGRDGHVYVTDTAANRVVKFTENGEYVSAWGDLGTEHGQFWKPKGVVQDDRDRVIVVDYGNHRVQIFAPDGEWLVSFGTGRAYTKWDRRRAPPKRKDQ